MDGSEAGVVGCCSEMRVSKRGGEMGGTDCGVAMGVIECDEVEAAELCGTTLGVASCDEERVCLLISRMRTSGSECNSRGSVEFLRGLWRAIGGVDSTVPSGGGRDPQSLKGYCQNSISHAWPLCHGVRCCFRALPCACLVGA